MTIRRLNDHGLERFYRELLEIKDRAREDLSPELVTDPELTSVISLTECVPRKFKSRWDVAGYLDDLILQGKLDDYARDAGFWAWLTVFHFDEICPKAADGSRPDLKSSTGVMRYYPQMTEWKRYYRHLLAGPWMIYRAHTEDPRRAMPLLATDVSSPGEAVEQIASRQEFVTSATIMEVVYRLYYDPKTTKLRRGSGRKERGGTRRFVTVLQQFDMTYDLYSLAPDRLLQLLPKEFDEFRSPAGK
jgi:hypothetical protein